MNKIINLINAYLKKKENIIFIILVLCAFVLHMHWLLWYSHSPHIFADMLGYWGNAAFFAGYDWTEIMGGIPYYSYGYSILLVPLLKIFDQMANAQTAAVLLNGSIVVMTMITLRQILISLFPEVKERIIISIVFLSSIYTSYIVQSNESWTETLLVFLFTLVIYCILNFNNNKYMPALLGFISIYIHAVHQRTLGVLIAVLVTYIIFFLNRLISKKQILSLMVSMIFFLNVHILIKSNLLNYYMFSSINDYTSVLLKIKDILSIKGMELFLMSFVRNIFSLGISTLLLAYWGYMFVIEELIIFLKNTKQNKNNLKYILSNKNQVFMFLSISIFISLIINSIFLMAPVRLDHSIYSRYNDIYVGILISFGSIAIFKQKNKIAFNFYLIIFFLILAVFTAKTLMNNEVFHPINASSFYLYYDKITGEINILSAFFMTSIISTFLILLSEFQNSKKFLFIGFIVYSMIFIFSSAIVLTENTLPRQNQLSGFITQFKTIVDKNPEYPVYFDLNQGNLSQNAYTASLLQIYLKNRPLTIFKNNENLQDIKAYFLSTDNNPSRYQKYKWIPVKSIDNLIIYESREDISSLYLYLKKPLIFNNYTSSFYFDSAWSVPENWGVWGLGEKHQLKIPLAEQIEYDLNLTIEARVFNRQRNVTIIVNGNSVQTLLVTPYNIASYTMPVDKTLFSGADEIEIVFVLDGESLSPQELGISADSRKLGLGLVSLKIEKNTERNDQN